jgi:hypothetical protein
MFKRKETFYGQKDNKQDSVAAEQEERRQKAKIWWEMIRIQVVMFILNRIKDISSLRRKKLLI